ncbi:MAG: sigma-70 family RNA polymerase sigma factor [Acidobacteria bacterium]|nr:sigma-70 family RNA polymerase sigma factor [Acidobacteriota bacterium]MCA1641354.1 sigma-70 family RNA polymerase sigma factor [Acidobacteriota bacterium]
MSFLEPVALRADVEMEVAAPSAHDSPSARTSAEAQFLELLRAGDAESFDRLVSDRSQDVYALLYRLTQDAEEARDLTQETFLQAFRSIAHFRGDADLRTWLYRIAVNQARNRWRWWRRRRRDATVSLDAPARDSEQPLSARLKDERGRDPEGETLAHERERALDAALQTLARPYREVVVLRDVEGLSYEEVAAALEISVGTVKSRLSRGRAELRRRLEGVL